MISSSSFFFFFNNFLSLIFFFFTIIKILKNIDLNKNISPKDIFFTLLSFYKNQIKGFLNESELLISRWIRFCKYGV